MFAVFFNVNKPEVSEKWIFLQEFPNRPMAQGYVYEAQRNRGYNLLLGISFDIREVP